MFFDFSRLSFGGYGRVDVRVAAGNFAGAGLEGGFGYSEGFEGRSPIAFFDVGDGAKVGGRFSYSATGGPSIGASLGFGEGLALGAGSSYTAITHEQSLLGAMLGAVLNLPVFGFMSGGSQDPATSHMFVPGHQ
jgi:hypothetical protein